MSKHKEALIRYRIIDYCLVNKKLVTIQDIIDACKDHDIFVSKRTIEDDIKNMKYDRGLGYNAPIINVRPKRYKYADPDFSINKLPLSDYEIDALKFAGQMFEQFSNMAPFDKIPGVVQKIFNHLKLRHHLNDHEFNQFIDFEKAPKTKGLEYLEPLIKAIRDKRAVKINYKSFTNNRTYKQTIHPYLIKEYRNRFYLFGYNEYWKGLRLYGLDRIENIEVLYAKKYRESKISPIEYFKNVIGVTKFSGTKPETIKLKVSKHQTPYLLTQPLHESQKLIEETPDYSIFTIEVHESPELEIKILGWHSEVEVLEPESLRKRIKEMIEGAAKVYGIV